MGITLDHIYVQTVDENGDLVEFIDRRKKENVDKPLKKKLELKSLGFYYKTDETKFVSD